MNRGHLLALLSAFILAPSIFTPARANPSEYGAAEYAVAMVERALALIEKVGFEAAVKEFHNPNNTDFHDRDLYVFALDDAGTSLANGSRPHVVGMNLLNVTDVDGKYYIRKLVAVGLTGTSGWVNYWIDSPATGTILQKSTYLVPFEPTRFVGVGNYKY